MTVAGALLLAPPLADALAGALEVALVDCGAEDELAEPLLQAGILCSVLAYMIHVDLRMAAVAIVFFVPQLIFVPMMQHARVHRHARHHKAAVPGHQEHRQMQDDAQSDQGAPKPEQARAAPLLQH